MKRLIVWFCAFCFSSSVAAFSQPCQLVAQMADSKTYKTKPLRVATMQAQGAVTQALNLTWLETHGAWHIYQTPTAWFDKQTCAPLTKAVMGKELEFMPVLLNQLSGHNAVITGAFIVKIYRKNHWQKVNEKYGFKVLSPLPNPKTMIVDVKPTNSYDLLIRALDKDKDVNLALPIFSEPR